MRNNSIDIIRGICMLLLIWYHAALMNLSEIGSCGKAWLHFSMAFTQPVFFFISGYFFNKPNTISMYLLKGKKLLLPFFLFSLISYSMVAFYGFFVLHNYSIQYIIDRGADFYPNGPIWFLFCMFIVYTLFCLIHRFVSSTIKLCVAAVLTAIVGFSLGKLNIHFFYIDSAISCLPFFIAGFLLKKNETIIRCWLPKRIKTAFVIVSLLVSWYLLFVNNGVIDFRINYYQVNILQLYIGGMLAIYVLWVIGEHVDKLSVKKSLLCYVGKNSMVLLCIHHLVLSATHSIITRINLPYGMAFGDFVITSFITISLIPILVSCFPYIWGIPSSHNSTK